MTNLLSQSKNFFRTLLTLFCGISLVAFNGCGKGVEKKGDKVDKQVVAKKEATAHPSKPAKPAEASDLSGKELYKIHCAACHHETGNGEGFGAQSVYPLPRNFLDNKFRIVSHKNRLPDVADMQHVIDIGMPGTSMIGFGMLHESDRRKMAKHVLVLWREGLRSQIREELKLEDEEINEAELDALVIERSTPKDRVQIPEFGDSIPERIQRGKQIYATQSCHSCHGADGTGVATIDLVDEDTQPVRPRDLVHESMKGGDSNEQLFLRILLGMPGTPHPSSENLESEQIVDLVHYLQSIASKEKIVLTGHQRRIYTSAAKYLEDLSELVRSSAE